MKGPEQLLPKELWLTKAQRDVLRVFEGVPADLKLTTKQIGVRLNMDQHWARKYLFHRLVALVKRGFLYRSDAGQRAYWQQGPLCDSLRDLGLMK